jgi:coenzyme F420-0:L-glutamate ligase/coenzyme F420-1:gamma-L-glutamate ligase
MRGARPFAVVRGRADLVLPPGDHGTGAGVLIRPDGADLFGYGAREAVIRAAGLRAADMRAFGAPVTAEDMVDVLVRVGFDETRTADDEVTCATDEIATVGILAMAHGWQLEVGEPGADLRLRPAST